jgi:hypothetical protein
LPSPDDFSDDGIPLERTKYLVAARSIVVLCRPATLTPKLPNAVNSSLLGVE